MNEGLSRRIDRGTDRSPSDAVFSQVRLPGAQRADAPSSSSTLYSRLSGRSAAVTTFVHRFRFVSASQVKRLFFNDNSPRSREVRLSKTMRRLVAWGLVARIPRAIGGFHGGSTGYIYTTPGSRSRQPDLHALDITELYVELVERERAGELKLVAFDPEPYSHTYMGHLELKPDAYVELGVGDKHREVWLEVDRSSEWRTQLARKMRRYVVAYNQWKLPKFPGVLWVVPDEQRKRLVESVAKRTGIPALFRVVTFDQAIDTLTK